MRPLTRSYFLLLLLGRLSLLWLSVLLGICLSSLWSPLFALHALAKVRLSLTFTLSPLMIWYSLLMTLFLFLLARAALAYLPIALSVALSPLFPFSRPSMLKFFRCSLRHSARSLLIPAAPTCLPFLFSSPTIKLSFYRHPVPSSIFLFASNCVADLAGTGFFFHLFYQAAMGPRTLVSPGERRG